MDLLSTSYGDQSLCRKATKDGIVPYVSSISDVEDGRVEGLEGLEGLEGWKGGRVEGRKGGREVEKENLKPPEEFDRV